MLKPQSHNLTGAIGRSVLFLQHDLFVWGGLIDFFAAVVWERERKVGFGMGEGWGGVLAWRRVIMGERRA